MIIRQGFDVLFFGVDQCAFGVEDVEIMVKPFSKVWRAAAYAERAAGSVSSLNVTTS